MNRRSFFCSTTATVALALAGCGSASSKPGPFSGRELRMFVYAGGHDETIRQVFVPLFEAATGANVTLFPGWWDGVTKLKTAPSNNPPFDLLITDATQGYPAAKEGLFTKINFANIPSVKELVPEALDNWIFRDAVGLPYPDSVMTLAFRKQTTQDDPQRWADLLRPEFDHRLGLYSSFYMSLFTLAAMMADADGKAGSASTLLQQQPDEVFRFAKAQRGRVNLWWPNTTEMILALNDDQIGAGNMHSPEFLQVLKGRPKLGGLVPQQDRAMVQVFWAIPTGSPNVDLAERALDLLFSDAVQSGFARRGMATARPDTAVAIANEDPVWKSLYPHTSEQFKNLKYYPYDFYAEHWDDFADRWDRSVLRDA